MDPKRMLAMETLKRILADTNGHDRRYIERAIRLHFKNGGDHLGVPVASLRGTFATWAWTFNEWREIFEDSTAMRRRELRRSSMRRIDEEKARKKREEEKRKKKKAEYMRDYMRKRRASARKSVDDTRSKW